MSRAREKKRRYPFRFRCSECPAVEIVYAEHSDDSDVKIAGRGWLRYPLRCLRCVTAADQKRTGVLEARA